ncbi:MAG TPA: hypothetical protein VJC15_03730 [Candidatus Paceibacterota bacterium]
MLENLKHLNKNYIVVAVFAALIFLFYGNTLQNGFVFDDIPQIEKNPQVQSLKYLPGSLLTCQWEFANQGCKGRTFYYRPMFTVMSILVWQISPNPLVFHLANLFYFLTIGFLIFYLFWLLLRNRIAAFFGAFLYLVHPLHTEVVNWVSGSLELSFAIVVLLTTIFFVKYRLEGLLKHRILMYAFFSLAIFTKEPAIFLPLVFLALDVWIFKKPIRRLLWFPEVTTYLVFTVPVLIYVFFRSIVVGFGLLGNTVLQFTFLERIHTMITLFAEYVSKLFYPHPLLVFHGLEKSANFNVSFFPSLFITVAFTALAFVLWRRKKNLLLFSMMWFCIFIAAPVVFLESVAETIFSERYAFVPAIGFVMFLGVLARDILQTYPELFQKTSFRLACTFVLVLLSVFSWFTIHERNKDWKDGETIYAKTVQQNPDAHPVRRDLGYFYLKEGEYEKAKVEFEELIHRAPDWKDITMAYKGLGDYYKLQGDEEKTLEYYVRATETSFSPRDYVVYNDVGVIYMDRGEYLKGFSYFCRSLQLLPENTATQQNFESSLALIEAEYIKLGKLYEAVEEQFEKAPTQKIAFLDKKCEEKICQYAFAFRGDQQVEALPPFLIAAQTQAGKEVTILNKGFDPTAGVIVLKVSSEFQDNTMTVLFPSCSGIYYEATNKDS